MENEKMFNVKNRSAGMVIYQIPELNIRREFAAGETQKISYSELEKLTYQAGGKELMRSFLQIDEEAAQDFNIDTEPEYFMNEEQVITLIKEGSMDAFLDALDYAPQGVLDLIKKYSVDLPMTNTEKIKALKDKTGFDAELAYKNSDKAEAEEAAKEPAAAAKPVSSTGRRTTANYKGESKYKVVKQD